MIHPFSLVNTNSKKILAGFGNSYGSREELQNLLNSYHPEFSIAEVYQVHSNKVIIIDQNNLCKSSSTHADAMVTQSRHISLLIKTADCFPLLFWDENSQVIGAAHSGREGTYHNISNSTIEKMVELGAEIDSIQVSIGPGISGEKYQVDKETWEAFCDKTKVIQQYRQLDLRKVIISQLLECGIKKEHIHNLQICTFSNSNYYSYRRDKTQKRLLSFITLL